MEFSEYLDSLRQTSFALSPDVLRILREINCFAVSSDDLTIIELKRKIRPTNKRIMLSELSRIRYLNLLDYERKTRDQDFHSSLLFMEPCLVYCRKFLENYEILFCASMFNFFIQHLKNRLDSKLENVTTIGKRIESVVECLKRVEIDAIDLSLNQFLKMEAYQNAELYFSVIKHTIFLEEDVSVYTYIMGDLLRYTFESSFFRKLLDVALEQRFDFWTMWERNNSFSTVPFCFVTSALFEAGDLEYLQVLLDYGFRQNRYRESTLKEALASASLINRDWLLRLVSTNGENSRSAVVSETLSFLILSASFPRRDHNDERDFMEYLQGFEMLWRTRREPFVTRKELQVAIEYATSQGILGIDVSPTRLDGFTRSLDECERLVKDYDWHASRPRSLKHLCRCSIRETLHDNWALPHGVEKLPLPNGIKSYILLKSATEDISRQKENLMVS